MDLTILNMPGSETWVREQQYEERNGPPIPNAVLQFYGPEHIASPRGSLYEILCQPDSQFDNVYHCAAILFPLPEAGDKNAIAPPVTKETFDQFRHPANKHLRDGLFHAFERCLRFFHLLYLDKRFGDDEKFPGRFALVIPDPDSFETHRAPFPKGDIDDDCKEITRSLREMFDGRYKMLGRMIKSLRVLGMQKEGLALYFGLRYIYRDADDYDKLPRPPAMEHWHDAAFAAFSYSIDDYHSAPQWLLDLDRQCKTSYYVGMDLEMGRDDVKKYIRSLTWVEGPTRTLDVRYEEYLKECAVKQRERHAQRKLENAEFKAELAALDNKHRRKDPQRRYLLRKDVVSEDPKDYMDSDSDDVDSDESTSEEEDPDWKCLDWDSDDESDYEEKHRGYDRHGRKLRGFVFDQYGEIAHMEGDREGVPSEEDDDHNHGDSDEAESADGQANVKGKQVDMTQDEAEDGKGPNDGIWAPDGTWIPANQWQEGSMEERGFTAENGWPVTGIMRIEDWLAAVNSSQQPQYLPGRIP